MSDLRSIKQEPPVSLGKARSRENMQPFSRIPNTEVLPTELPALQEGCSASPISDDNMFVWNATLVGPQDTPW